MTRSKNYLRFAILTFIGWNWENYVINKIDMPI